MAMDITDVSIGNLFILRISFQDNPLPADPETGVLPPAGTQTSPATRPPNPHNPHHSEASQVSGGPCSSHPTTRPLTKTLTNPHPHNKNPDIQPATKSPAHKHFQGCYPGLSTPEVPKRQHHHPAVNTPETRTQRPDTQATPRKRPPALPTRQRRPNVDDDGRG